MVLLLLRPSNHESPASPCLIQWSALEKSFVAMSIRSPATLAQGDYSSSNGRQQQTRRNDNNRSKQEQREKISWIQALSCYATHDISRSATRPRTQAYAQHLCHMPAL